MAVGGSQQKTLGPGFVIFGARQQDVPVILRGLMLPDGFDAVSSGFTGRDFTTGPSWPRLTSCGIEIYSQLIDH
ncbi:unnamed protein product [Schistosoma mattheei]|uniref:Uncharacterized protein n=1 Tax=Schistosoma mattheei TaxID=31246 RepID=A0A183NJ85_9TREM|nr:unnamed protein product [Schistosoma mattheei]